MINFSKKERYDFNDLVEIMKLLRSKDGCPWDREQSHESIRRNFIEEVYEVAEAIDEKSPAHLCEELGDVMLQVVFHAEMEREKGTFGIADVSDGICKKLILRHPHIFGEVKVSGAEEVLSNWDDIKRKEKGQKSMTDAMESVARSLPSLIRAEKVQKKASKVGFDFPELSGAIAKVEEETKELIEAAKTGNTQNCDEELGDLLFAVVNVARFLKSDPEQALERACDKFIRRFSRMEESAGEKGRDLKDMTLCEMDKLWEENKG